MKFHHCAIIILFLGVTGAWAAGNNPPLVQEIVTAAQRGEADAQFQLARAYLRGEGVPKDVKKAFELMKAAADLGHADAIGGLGYFHSLGVVVPKDEKKALEWFRKGAEKDSTKAQLNLGKFLVDGKGGSDEPSEKLRDEGIRWIMKSADQGLAEAELAYGKILYFGDYGQAQDYKKALIYLNPAANAGLPDAQNMLGSMYQCGSGVKFDAVIAEQWYRKAALQGHSKAQGNLGMILGPLVENKETRIEALAWLLMAAEQNQVTAIKALRDAGPPRAGEMEEARAKMEELAKLVKHQTP